MLILLEIAHAVFLFAASSGAALIGAETLGFVGALVGVWIVLQLFED